MGALNHFKKYRQIASVAISSGGPLSYFIIPPIIAQFLKEQGWREANLFCGLLCLQVRRVWTMFVRKSSAQRDDTSCVTESMMLYLLFAGSCACGIVATSKS